MAKRIPFALVYAEAVMNHLLSIDGKFHSTIRIGIESQLQFEPERETRNRKPLKRPIAVGGDWELRLGPQNRFRVFYEVDRKGREVRILAIGIKEGNRLYFGGEEYEE